MSEPAKYLNPEVLSKIGRLELRARMVVEGFISGLHHSPYQGQSVEFASHREYVAGDDTRHVDWRVFARADRLYVKQYEEETNLRTQVVLDCSGSMAYPDPPPNDRLTKYDYAATVAASLIYLLMRQQDACGLLLFDDEVRDYVPTTSNHGQLLAMIERLEAQSPNETTDIKAALDRVAEVLPKRGLVVLISDLLTDEDRVIAGLQRLGHAQHDVIVLHVLDHDEIEFPFAENVMFEGLEAAELEILTDPQSLRASYREIVQAFVNKVRAACMNHRIDYTLISTKTPMDAALTAFLASRMHRLARER